ncbi:hypothetical protein ACE1AT_21970 [Pelatocladus sp. BLCC-F211]|uniref:hypothetical protein n=1 Tax=Pelatocladus sp. BLCC-F211 TaxID=3342752 RepID=UPI0035B895A3
MINQSENQTTGHIRVGNSSQIDFAFWILLQDGLHVPPFDKHTGGNLCLQQHAMDAQSWYNWLQLLLIGHDNRLAWHVEDIDKETQQRVQSFKQILDVNQEHNIICNEDWYSEQQQFYSSLLTEQEQSYQEALEDYQDINLEIINQNPPQLWQGSPQIQEILAQMWSDYQTVKYSNQFITELLTRPLPWDIYLADHTNSYREIYLVDYPYSIEVFVPPIFGMVTIPNCPIDESLLEQKLFNLVNNS